MSLKLYEPGVSRCSQCLELLDPSTDSVDADLCAACEWAEERYIITMAQAQAEERKGA